MVIGGVGPASVDRFSLTRFCCGRLSDREGEAGEAPAEPSTCEYYRVFSPPTLLLLRTTSPTRKRGTFIVKLDTLASLLGFDSDTAAHCG